MPRKKNTHTSRKRGERCSLKTGIASYKKKKKPHRTMLRLRKRRYVPMFFTFPFISILQLLGESNSNCTIEMHTTCIFPVSKQTQALHIWEDVHTYLLSWLRIMSSAAILFLLLFFLKKKLDVLLSACCLQTDHRFRVALFTSGCRCCRLISAAAATAAASYTLFC